LSEAAQLRAALASKIKLNFGSIEQECLYKVAMTSNAAPDISSSAAYVFPLSFAQQRLWFLNQLAPQNPFYNVPAAVRLTGCLHIDALEQALDEIVRRHETLRTAFRAIDGQPRQIIAPHLTLDLPLIDLQTFPVEERQTHQQRLTAAAAEQPFDLAEGNLLRAQLLRLEDAEHLLLLTLHHIIADGWSIGVLLRELGTLYAAFAAGEPSPLPELPIQYADFAQWQRQWFQGAALQPQLDYWQQQLADLPALELPLDRPRPPMQTYRGATQVLELSLELSQALETLSQQAGVTLFITLLAALQTLLYRYTGQTDIAIGSPIANRNRSEIEGLIGFFVNTLVMRTDLSGNPTFRELLERVRTVALGAYSHQDLPFERLVEALQPTRSLSHTPLVQAMFALQSTPTPPLELAGLTLEFLEIDTHVAKFDFTLSFENTADGLKGALEYSTDLFEHSTIERLLHHLQMLLQGIVANPDQPIAQLPMLSAAEQQQLLIDWNNTAIDYPIDRRVHHLFEAQVRQTPDAVALAFTAGQLSYEALNVRANQVAHQLQQLGVRPEVRVGLCCDRSPEWVIGMFAILKAGGAYVPVDPQSPSARLKWMLRDAQVAIVLTQQFWVSKLLDSAPDEPPDRQMSGLEIICLDQLPPAEAQPVANPTSIVGANQLAYVIYTSGSTGEPKGVAIEHRSLLNLVFWHQQTFAVTAADRATQIAAPAFDACGWEILPYLTVGASVHFPKPATRMAPTALRDWLVAEQITFSFVPTPLAEQMLALDWHGTALRALLVGGDRLHPLPRSLPFRVVNHYGPTENTVVTTWATVAANAGVPPIGRPIANTQVYVLDAHLQPVPIGAVGELYISGDGLARGYWQRPEQTAQRFLPNPFSAQPRSRLYRTSDTVRYRPDGNLEFVGRTDQQVKIRGFRVELGEVEQTLAQHPQVREAVVVAKSVAGDERRLAAYVVADGEPLLRPFLTARLPDYMIPAVFVTLTALPLTPNGKVDRRALAALVPPPVNSAASIAPQTAIEAALVPLWCEVLGLRQVGVHDNFFALGGHSLLATQLTSRIRDVLHVDVPLPTFFELPTVAAIAQYIETIRWASDRQSAQLDHSHAQSDLREEVEF
jgi:amino acid adenylation domain-containing protein